MNIYQLEDYDVQGVDAGSKARIDVCQILHEQGIKPFCIIMKKVG